MEQYIPKSDLVAELERRLEELYKLLPDASKVENGGINVSDACNTGKYTALESFKDYVDSLEVKEMNLDEETLHSELRKIYASVYDSKDIEAAKHFFELGIRASNPLTWEDIKLIWTIGDEIPYMPEEDFFKELLKRFKAKKGE